MSVDYSPPRFEFHFQNTEGIPEEANNYLTGNANGRRTNMCNKCQNGLIPFINKDGNPVADTFLFCKCHPIYGLNAHYGIPIATEGKRPPTRGTIPRGRAHLYVDDFDFPMSYTVYRALCQEHGWQDPGDDYASTPVQPQEQIIVHRHSDMSKQDFDLLQQTAAAVKYLREKLSGKEQRGKQGRYGYKGIK